MRRCWVAEQDGRAGAGLGSASSARTSRRNPAYLACSRRVPRASAPAFVLEVSGQPTGGDRHHPQQISVQADVILDDRLVAPNISP